MAPVGACRHDLGASAIGGRGSVRPMPPAPRGSWGRASAPAAPVPPSRPPPLPTSCGRGRPGGLAASTFRSRRRPRPRTRPATRRLPAGRRRADWRGSAKALGWRRCGCLSHVRPGGGAARRRARPVLCPWLSGFVGLGGAAAGPLGGVDGRLGRPAGRTGPGSATLGHGLLGHGRRGCVCGSTPSPWTRRSSVRLRCSDRSSAPSSLGRTGASAFCRVGVRCSSVRRCLLFWRSLPDRSPVPAAPAPPGSAPAAPPVRARGRGSPVHPTGRSAVGRSGGGRSLPAPVAQRLRSLDPSLLPSLGARGRSGSSTVGCGGAVLRDGCSVAHAAAPAACGAEDLLVQPFVPVRGRAACLAILR